MDIYNDINKLSNTPCVLALGNFDGVHTGHAKLLSEAIKLSRVLGCIAGVYTFAVNSKILLGAKDFKLLTTDHEKNRIFADAGIDFVCYDDFMGIKDLSPEAFCDYLADRISVKAVICGENYTFGKSAAAGSAELVSLMKKRNVQCITVPGHSLNGITVSSTAIRKLISEGNTDTAFKMLGYRYFIEAEVIHGARLGRTLGFPTINQPVYGNKVVPLYGVYLCMCYFDDMCFPGVVNVGVKPTVSHNNEAANAVFETHILDYDGDIYGKTVKLEFYKMLRPERKFPSLDALKESVLNDIREARAFFGKEGFLQ